MKVKSVVVLVALATCTATVQAGTIPAPGWGLGTWHLQNVVLSNGSTLTGDFIVTAPFNGPTYLNCCNGFRDDAIGLAAGFTWMDLSLGFGEVPGVTSTGFTFNSFTNNQIDFGDGQGQGTIDNHRFYSIVLNFDSFPPDATTLNIDVTSSRIIKHVVNPTLGGNYVYDIVSGSATVTPLPGALPLFVTGLGALGLLGWRRKWKTDH